MFTEVLNFGIVVSHSHMSLRSLTWPYVSMPVCRRLTLSSSKAEDIIWDPFITAVGCIFFNSFWNTSKDSLQPTYKMPFTLSLTKICTMKRTLRWVGGSSNVMSMIRSILWLKSLARN